MMNKLQYLIELEQYHIILQNSTRGRLTFLHVSPFFIPTKKAANKWSSSSMSITSTISSARSRNRLGWRPSLSDVRDTSVCDVVWSCDAWLWCVWWNQATPVRFKPISVWTVLLRWPPNMSQNQNSDAFSKQTKKFRSFWHTFGKSLQVRCVLSRRYHFAADMLSCKKNHNIQMQMRTETTISEITQKRSWSFDCEVSIVAKSFL